MIHRFSHVEFKKRLSYELRSDNTADIKWLEKAFESPNYVCNICIRISDSQCLRRAEEYRLV